jgi:uncharacterized protein involved in outer membrane biogenesis
MKTSLVVRRIAITTLAAVAALIALTAALCVAVDAGYGRWLLIHYVAARTGRTIQVNGSLRAHVLSHRPWIVAEDVVIGNPPWMPAGLTAEAGKLTFVFTWPGFNHPSSIAELDLESPKFYLVRDASGHANWQLTDPARRRAPNSTIIRSLSVPDARVTLHDARRHLQFAGTVSASGAATGQSLRIRGKGQLNGRPASFEVVGEPLDTASHERPYHFSFSERSSGSRLEASGSLPRPFDFAAVDTAFEASGLDLKDLYFLTGVRLLDTGQYHLKGKASRRGPYTDYSDLVVTSGQSDVRGTVSVDVSGARRKLELNLSSATLRLSDLGLRAAGRTSEPPSPLLLSSARLNPRVLQVAEAKIRFRAQEVDVGRLPVHDVSARATIDHGVLTVAALRAEVLGGTLDGHLVLDARKNVPAAKVDLKIDGLQLAQLPHKDPHQPPAEGAMQAQVRVTGSGSSVHEVAASANGTVRAQLPHGALLATVAEFAGGPDLRGLRLLLTHSSKEVQVRCAVADFKADGGTLMAQNMVADTDPVLITGDGQIHLDSETLDLVIHGQPKSPRFLRLRAPVLVRGTLAHPSLGMQRSKSVAIVDPGKAKDADCPSLLSAADPAAP